MAIIYKTGAEVKPAIFLKGIDWRDLQDKLQLNENELEIVQSLQAEKGQYAELFLIQGEHRAVVRVAPDSLAYWVATSDAEDNAKIERAKRENSRDLTMGVLQSLAI